MASARGRDRRLRRRPRERCRRRANRRDVFHRGRRRSLEAVERRRLLEPARQRTRRVVSATRRTVPRGQRRPRRRDRVGYDVVGVVSRVFHRGRRRVFPRGPGRVRTLRRQPSFATWVAAWNPNSDLLEVLHNRGQVMFAVDSETGQSDADEFLGGDDA